MFKCKWPSCSEEQDVNKSGFRKGYCKKHHSWNVSRYRSGLSFEEFELQNLQDKIETKDGYINILINGKKIPEHRYIMEQILGRPLIKGESVHHKNGIRNDNRKENLELWVGNIRYGQRAIDIICPKCKCSYWDTATKDTVAMATLVFPSLS